jgi:murein peptide amidase A
MGGNQRRMRGWHAALLLIGLSSANSAWGSASALPASVPATVVMTTPSSTPVERASDGHLSLPTAPLPAPLMPEAAITPTVTRSVIAACERLAARLPSYNKKACAQTGLSDSGIRSIRREPILVREQRAMPEPVEGATRVLFIGGIHGDELTAAELSLRWLNRLGQEDARRFHWRMIPVLNPDGVMASRPTRVNANGVDLNRNFPSGDWAGGALRYWERMTMRDPRRFPGRAPVTEPESKFLTDEIERFQPDVIISVHAPLGLLDFDGPTGAAPSQFGKLYLEPVGVYPGSLGSYSGITLGIPVVTLELPHALKMPTRDEQEKIWSDMLAWLAKQPSRMAQGPVRQP